MSALLIDFSRSDEAARVFGEAFEHPEQAYVIQPVEAAIARTWLRENASMVNFAWRGGVKPLRQRLAEGGPLSKAELIHLDELYGRNRCGWLSEAGAYLCDAPPDKDSAVDDETGKRQCFGWNCPIAYEADRDDIREKDPDLWRSDFEPYPDEKPHDYMVLHSRPRYAYAPNVTVLGCEGWEDYA